MLDRHSLRRDVTLLLAVLLLYFLSFLGARPLNVPDEGRYPEAAREMLLSGDFITPHVNGVVFLDKPALYYWLEASSMHVFGVDEWSIRLVPALFGVLGCLLVFMTARRLFSRRAGWLAALVLACNPLYFLLSQYANLDLEVAVWVSASLCLFLLARTHDEDSQARRRLFWAAYACMGLGVLTKGLIGVVFPGMVVVAWLLLTQRWRELRTWYPVSGTLIFLLVCLPWFIAVQLHNPQFFHYFFVYQQFERFSGGGFNNAFPVWFYAPVVVLGLLPWSVWLPAALTQQLRYLFDGDETARARCLLLLWPLLIFVFFSIPASKIVSYILPVVPPLAIMLGDYLDRRLQTRGGSGWLPLLVAGLFIAGAAALATRIAAISGLFGGGLLELKLWLMAVLLLLVGVALLYCCWRGLRQTLAALAVGGVLLALGPALLYGSFDRDTILPLARQLQALQRPGDVVVCWGFYYQDLPVYLQSRQPVPVVYDWSDPKIMQVDNWKREFLLALHAQPEARQWLIDEAGFAKLLSGKQRVWVLVQPQHAAELIRRYGLRAQGGNAAATLLLSGAQMPRAGS